MPVKTHARVAVDRWMRLVSNVAQKAANAKETNVTRPEPRECGGLSNVKVKTRGDNGRGNKPNKIDNNSLNRPMSRPQDQLDPNDLETQNVYY